VFNIGPLELVVLAFVGLVVLGPERVPGLARDAGRMIRTLRELATGARTQLREELGPEFADIDLRSLNPRTAITQALLGEDLAPGAGGKNVWQRALLGDPASGADATTSPTAATVSGPDDAGVKPVTAPVERIAQRPLGRDEAAPFDSDAT
jgi:sec-independent protein translocase protein TatB